MKRIIALGLSSLLVIPIISTSIVFAVEDGTTMPTDTTVKPVVDEAKAKALAERIQKHKTELKIKLLNAEKLRLLTKCKASQGLVSSVSGRIKGIETSRTQVYNKMIERLTDLSTKLKNKGVDTTSLDEALAVLKTKIETFNTDLATYKESVSDLAEIDCKTDPEGFKTLLEVARANQQKVKEDGLAIRAHLKDVIKPILATIRSQLESKSDNVTSEGSQ